MSCEPQHWWRQPVSETTTTAVCHAFLSLLPGVGFTVLGVRPGQHPVLEQVCEKDDDIGDDALLLLLETHLIVPTTVRDVANFASELVVLVQNENVTGLPLVGTVGHQWLG